MQDWGSEGVDHFVSIGSPHMPPPKGALVFAEVRFDAPGDCC